MKKILLIAAVLCILVSCATKNRVVETESASTEVKIDSFNLQSVKTDSSVTSHKTEQAEVEKIHTETKIEKSDSTVTTVDADGNVVKQETWHKEKETISRNREYERLLRDSVEHLKVTCDSLKQYASKCDSLQEKLSHKEYITVEKIKIPKWCYYCLGISVIFIIFAFIKIYRWLLAR